MKSVAWHGETKVSRVKQGSSKMVVHSEKLKTQRSKDDRYKW